MKLVKIKIQNYEYQIVGGLPQKYQVIPPPATPIKQPTLPVPGKIDGQPTGAFRGGNCRLSPRKHFWRFDCLGQTVNLKEKTFQEINKSFGGWSLSQHLK